MTPRAAQRSAQSWFPGTQLFERADILTIHLVLRSRTRGLCIREWIRISNAWF